MMILVENEVIAFQKSPWNALCKNGFFKTKFKDVFSIEQHQNFCTFDSPFMFKKSLGYAIKNSKDSTEFQKKIVIFKTIKNYKI